MRSSRLPIAAALLGVAAAACTSPSGLGPEDVLTPSPYPDSALPRADDDAPATVTTTSLDGNRVVAGRLGDGRLVRLAAGLVPEVLVAAPLEEGVLLVATDRDGVAGWILGPDGVRTAPPNLLDALGAPPDVGRPALVRHGDGWRFARWTGPGDPDWVTADGTVEREGTAVRFGAARVEDVLPDARWAVDGTRLVVPTTPTTEYGHAVLGDGVEAAGLALADARSGEVEQVTFPPGVVLEGTGVLLADIDADGTSEPVFTLSDADGGARQAALVDGVLVEGPPIGLGNRWRHLLGVQDGRIHEVVTPHLARTFQTLELRGGALEVLTSTAGTLASHAIGSRDLDQVVLVDATGDGRVDAVGPADGEPDVVRIIDGTDGSTVRRVGLSAPMVSNALGLTLGDRAVVAVGSGDGTVLLLGLDE